MEPKGYENISVYKAENIVNTSCGILTNLYLIQYEE